jgi:ubiquitin-conjugating enzyme E2 J1
MSTAGQFSTKNPTIKRILKEASELASSPSADYHAAPLETDLFEWHFTIRGPPAPSHFEGGLYHGRIVLPPAYPLKPPSFRFLTPSGRFEPNREICLSISGHHEESWQPAWGIRTALVAIRSFMDTDAKGQLGGMDAGEAIRRKMAKESTQWKCGACGRINAEVMKEQAEAAAGEEGRKEEEVPEQLRLAFREDLGKGATGDEAGKAEANGAPYHNTEAAPVVSAPVSAVPQTPATPTVQPTRTVQVPMAQAQRAPAAHGDDIPAWIDKAIIGIVFAIIAIIWLRFFG